ncbi:MAG: hypothetical protein LBS75_01120 [Synergistaceae bacterium]|nr:hypothetical protein [Synergistaceae bacterium]
MRQDLDNAIGCIVEKWKDDKEISTLARQMEVLGRNMSKLRDGKDSETRKKARIVWQKAAAQYWDLLWAIVEAKIDVGPPDELEFDDAERLFIDYGHLSSKYTTPNPFFEEQLAATSAVDMYQYNRMTDYIKENYALIFGKPYKGPSGGVTLEEKLKRFNDELRMTKARRRTALSTLVSKIDLIEKSELNETLLHLEEGLQDAVETDMRTKRVREADNAARNVIKDHCKRYEVAERTFWYLIDSLERKLIKQEEPKQEDSPAEPSPPADGSEPPKREVIFDPFAEIEDDDCYSSPAFNAPPPDIDETLPEHERMADMSEEEGFQDSEATAETMREEPSREDHAEAPDQSLKIIQNVLSLHDKTKFLAGLIVHVTNESERWRTRCEMSKNKHKGQGLPALKLELREGLNHKKEFMMLAARTARVDPSPLCQNKNKPISTARAGEVMMDLTPLDPDMLRASRIRMYGIPRVILVPGQGLGVYDWEDNSLIIPIFDVVSDVKDFCFALASFRWDNDEDRTLKDTYALLKVNKGKGIRALQESFMTDYFLWISKERKGYRILPREVSKWFKTFFKQKSGTGADKK